MFNMTSTHSVTSDKRNCACLDAVSEVRDHVRLSRKRGKVKEGPDLGKWPDIGQRQRHTTMHRISSTLSRSLAAQCIAAPLVSRSDECGRCWFSYAAVGGLIGCVKTALRAEHRRPKRRTRTRRQKDSNRNVLLVEVISAPRQMNCASRQLFSVLDRPSSPLQARPKLYGRSSQLPASARRLRRRRPMRHLRRWLLTVDPRDGGQRPTVRLTRNRDGGKS